MMSESQDDLVTPELKNELLIEELDNEEEEAPSENAYSIECYGLDYDVRGLSQRFIAQDILVPFYQRAEVWNSAMKSSLIESFLLGLPVPGIFLSKDAKSGVLFVIDGRQRLSAIADFYQDAFSLSGKSILPIFRGLKYSTLSAESRRKLDNSILHATIVKQLQPVGTSGIIQIFKRLNEKPTPLTAQEIRSSVFHGPFNDLIEKMNSSEPWRSIWGSKDPHKRLKDQEIILRALAFTYFLDKYRRPMSTFLDLFMESNRSFEILSADAIYDQFMKAITMVMDGIGETAFKEQSKTGTWLFKVNLFDGAIVGIIHGIRVGKCTLDNIKDLYEELLQDHEFNFGISEFTNDLDKIQARCNAAIRVFSGGA